MKNFSSGGLYVLNERKSKVYIDDLCEIGDLFLFNAEVPHGVEAIDPDQRLDWQNSEGRWMLLCSTIKTNTNLTIENAVEIK